MEIPIVVVQSRIKAQPPYAIEVACITLIHTATSSHKYFGDICGKTNMDDQQKINLFRISTYEETWFVLFLHLCLLFAASRAETSPSLDPCLLRANDS